ncbi:MAG: selenocysteine-specific translation elongation factor [Candidatus Eremiobacteraeota bacterium]|nr:selenocysteine-specific translation elongation factor [Candidatus Eremiobacteraeota bacterium]
MAGEVKNAPPSEIMQVIIGTAGHVDHGKTCLVKALTGCDTDRLPEEKLRGLSIDLGFAPCRLPGNRIVGIVDVPGHEDFIRNMIAGAASIDVLMLVIAANDGIMPQTREHLQIVQLLKTPLVMVVLTKVDLVDAEIRETVTLEVREFLARNGYPDAPLIPFSSVTGEGYQQVRRTIDKLASQVSFAPDARAFRMNVERVFSAKGYGTVVTGIPISGCGHIGDTVELHPARRHYVIRSIQAYKHDLDIAPAHACAAINLRDIEAEIVARGMTIGAPGLYGATSSAVASLKNTTDSLKLPRLSDAWFLSGTSKTRVKVRLLEGSQLPPGVETFVHMALEEPVVLAAGDRYVIRLLNPMVTFGGGDILSTAPFHKKKTAPNFLEVLQKAHLAALEGNLLLCELMAGSFTVVTKGDLAEKAHMEEKDAAPALKALMESGSLIDVGGGAFLVRERLPLVESQMVKILEGYHRTKPMSWGIDTPYVCRLMGIEARSLPKLPEVLAAGGRIVFRHNRYALPDFKPSLKSFDMELKEKILSFIEKGGLDAQAQGTIMERFGLDAGKLSQFLRLLIEEGQVRLFGNHVIHVRHYEAIREKLLELFRSRESVTIAELRASLGSGRHYAVDLLESFDTEGMTRRVNGGRVLVKTWKKAFEPPI